MTYEIHLYQTAIALLSSAMIFQGVKKFFQKKEGQTFLKLFVRIAVWGGMAVVAIFPKITNDLAFLIGMEGNVNAVILTGFILVFLMIFKLLSAIERLEQQISQLTREESLKEIENIKK